VVLLEDPVVVLPEDQTEVILRFRVMLKKESFG
jgi:hypothetical protein